ncbi:MAG TPA: alpha/beta hydrolase [Cyclobacteriaceae bacterium]|nr:alpha/beta hydrolase [Cyclobacteriaceae bacterium]
MKRILFLLLVISLGTNAQEQLIKVNGNNYHVYLKGFEGRKTGMPVLIFENGLGVGLGNWDTILESLAQAAPVFAYDRAGVETSDVQYKMPTINQVADNLKSILTTLQIAPPYILVGHSLGGVYTRGFAGLCPKDIEGLIFIDPADFTETKEDRNVLLRDLGVAPKRIDEMAYERLKKSEVDSLHFGPWSEGEVLKMLRQTDFAELNKLPLPNVPICFFIGGKFEVPPERWSKDFNQPAFFALRTSRDMERWKKVVYASGKGGSLIFLSTSGHFVHRDDPKAVIGNIKIMIEGLNKK